MSADRPPSSALRSVLSALLILHFAAIVVAVTGASSGRFSAPPILAEAHDLLDPYLQATFLGNSYRFFAPNPSADPVLWARVRFADGRTATIEWPHFRDRGTSVAYTRDFSIPRGVARIQSHGPGQPATLSQESETLLGSAARRMAKFVVPDTFPGTKRRVATVDLYLLERRLPTPAEVRASSQIPDMSLYEATHLGRFTEQGKRVGPGSPERIALDSLLATIIDRDIRPSLTPPASRTAPDRYPQRWPTLVDSLLQEKPELLDLGREELTDELRKFTSRQSSDDALKLHF